MWLGTAVHVIPFLRTDQHSRIRTAFGVRPVRQNLPVNLNLQNRLLNKNKNVMDTKHLITTLGAR